MSSFSPCARTGRENTIKVALSLYNSEEGMPPSFTRALSSRRRIGVDPLLETKHVSCHGPFSTIGEEAEPAAPKACNVVPL